jgi:hypothetical protein
VFCCLYFLTSKLSPDGKLWGAREKRAKEKAEALKNPVKGKKKK